MRTVPESRDLAPHSILNHPPLVPSRREHAQPLVPAWLLAAVAGVALVLFVAHAPDQGHPTLIVASQHRPSPAPGPCGAGWQIRREAAGFTLHTVDASPHANSTPCTLPITAPLGAVDVHAAGDEAVLSTAVTHVAATIPASGWYAVPVNPGGDALIVAPGFGGGALTLSVVIPRH